jgi:hypothetical protein
VLTAANEQVFATTIAQAAALIERDDIRLRRKKRVDN